MSVVLLSPELYKEVYNKVCQCSGGEKSEMGKLDCFSHKTEKQIREWIMTLYEMNEASYAAYYEEELCIERMELVKNEMAKWKYDNIPTKLCNIYQLLKWLQCIKYQIEEITIKEAGLWKLEYVRPMYMLGNSIDCITYNIIDNIPEYKEAKWWDV